VIRPSSSLWALVLALIVWPTFATAEQPNIEISTALDPSDVVVPGQRVRLTITIATPRWFTRGTEISLPEVPGLILLRNQQFASNATERRGGESWSLQRWSIDAFPVEEGLLRIPPIELAVSVSTGPTTKQQATLKTPWLSIEARIPEALTGVDHWIASPSVVLEQTVETGDVVVGSSIPLGTAISRRLTISAQDVMAMMLPKAEAFSDPLLQTYPEPPVLQNRASRGALQARRSERTVWIASAPGTTVIPPTTLNWWNTDTGQLQVLSSEPVALTISGELPPRPITREQWLMGALYGGLMAGFLLAGTLAWRWGVFAFCLRQIASAGRWSAAQWRAARAPALPDRLNPGGTRGGPGASSRPGR